MTKPRCIVHQIQQSITLFDTTTREIGSIDVALRYLPLEAIGKRLGKKEAQFDCFDRSYIWGFDNAQYQGYGKT